MRLGALALGDTFAWGDTLAYLVGIALGAVVEWAARRDGSGLGGTA
jgi:hypothetical protein